MFVESVSVYNLENSPSRNRYLINMTNGMALRIHQSDRDRYDVTILTAHRESPIMLKKPFGEANALYEKIKKAWVKTDPIIIV